MAKDVPVDDTSLLEGELVDLDQSWEQKIGRDFRIVTEQARYQVVQIPDLVAGSTWNLTPDFQRRHRWDDKRRSRLIESFMLNVPIPPIFLYESDLGQFEVMDGLQRLTAIREFYGGVYSLEGLEVLSDLNEKKYSELPERDQRTIDRRYLSAVILLHETGKSPEEASQLKQLVFERINSGGVDLTPQESRNALFAGPMNDLCTELAGTNAFVQMWGFGDDSMAVSEPSGRSQVSRVRSMYDVELVLRFFAYRQRRSGRVGRLTKNQRQYLDSYLRSANNFSPVLISQLRELFLETARLIFEIFGESAFWLYRKRHSGWVWITEPTVVVYEPLMFAISQRIDYSSELLQNASALAEGRESLYSSNERVMDGRRVNASDVDARNKLLLRYVDTHLTKSGTR
ncbi:DUF262 domain-containing protein [Rhodococcus sp. 077-4]|uniref:DUF262 domain-containing protein n=1 Tax=Rhodococcus sp. 077-4 TaxID=2789271 RepID=UPI0039F49999